MTHSSDVSQKLPSLFGLDVHQNTIVIAQAEGWGEPKYVCTLDHNPSEVTRFFKGRVGEGPVFTVYEAGGCGFALHRRLEGLGVTNLICAPSKIARAKGNQVKNDKRDAILLARLPRNQLLTGHRELHEVFVPDTQDEAMREKTRQRETFKRQVRATQNQIMGMLRRHGKRYQLTKRAWTKTYRAWLLRVDFRNALIQDTFRGYLDHLSYLEEQLHQCDEEIQTLCDDWNKVQLVKNLTALKGVQTLTAVQLVAEIGCFSRFEKASQLMGYLGLTPTEYSSGLKTTRGAISKAGNTRVRTLLIEAACCAYRKPKPKGGLLRRMPKGDTQGDPRACLQGSAPTLQTILATHPKGQEHQCRQDGCSPRVSGFRLGGWSHDRILAHIILKKSCLT